MRELTLGIEELEGRVVPGVIINPIVFLGGGNSPVFVNTLSNDLVTPSGTTVHLAATVIDRLAANHNETLVRVTAE